MLEVRHQADAGDMARRQVAVLRIAIGALALAALVLQVVVVPLVAAACAVAHPDVEYLERPYVAAVAVALVGFEVALFSAWHLLRAPAAAELSTRSTTRWADILAGSLVAMAVILAGVCAHAAFAANVGGPLTMLGLLASVAVVPSAIVLRRRAVSSTLRDGGPRTPLGRAR